jgi:histidinol-phosphate/aromatic aminotransferase/cobyric acid decarboxylase-like protein
MNLNEYRFKLTLFPEKILRLVFFISIIIILLYILYKIFTNIIKKYNIRNEIIVSNVGEPYFIEDSIAPVTISLTGDLPNENGGLSYLKLYTDKLNEEMIHHYYKQEYDIVLPNDTIIVFGAGTTMMVGALYYALQKKLGRPITARTNTDVFYLLHEKITFPLRNISWVDKNSSADLSVIVSPGNPNGLITSPKTIRDKYMLYDIVYDKPLFSGKYNSINQDLYKEFKVNENIFITSSFSKLGIPGARFGFLITRNNEIANYCREFVDINSVRYPTAGATIARLCYYKYFKNKSWQMKNYNILEERKKQIKKYMKLLGINILNDMKYIPYAYTDRSNNWWMENFKIDTRKGSDFNDNDKNSRINLMIRHDEWDEIIRRFDYKLNVQ